jgi:hypothetical protein
MPTPIATELITFIIRQTGWHLEYVKSLPVHEALELVGELRFQKSVDDYNAAVNFAMAVRGVREFLNKPPQREQRSETDIWTIAEKAGIKIPGQR